MPKQEARTLPKLGQVLVADDEPALLNALCEVLREQGYEAVGFASGREALAALEERDFDLLLTDLMMPGMDGIALLKASLELDPHLVGIVMTGQGTVQSAVGAMKTGAFDYVLKPFKARELLPVLSRAMGVRRLRLENVELRQTAAVYDLTAMVAFTLDLNLILDKTAETALLQCQADEVSILLPAEEGEEFYVAMVSGAEREHILGERVPMDQGIAGWVARHHEPLVLRGAVVDPRFAPLNPRADIQVAASLPMVVGGRLVGVLNVNALRRRRPFTPGEMKALRLLTSIASAALESAQLYAQARAAEEQYQAIFDHAVVGIFQASPEGRFLKANLAQARMLGYESPEELINAVTDIGWQVYTDPQRREEFKRRLEAEGVVRGFEVEARRRDGSTLWVLISARALRNAEGATCCYEGMVENITARKRQEQEEKALQQVRGEVWRMRDIEQITEVLESLKKALDALKVPFLSCAVNVVGGSESLTVRGYEIGRDLQWKNWEGSAEDKAAVRFVCEFWRGGRYVYRPDLEREDPYQERDKLAEHYGLHRRSVIDVPFSHGTLALNSDRPEAFSEEDIAFLEQLARVLSEGFQRQDDFKKLHEAQQQLYQSQKLEALGRLAGGVAHDFNNLITVIDGYSVMALKQLPQGDGLLRSAIEEVQRAGERAEGLVRQLLAFSRHQHSERQTLDLNQVVSGVEKMLRRLIGEDVELRVQLALGAGRVEADPGQLEQVLMNLAINARDAMPQGGQLTIETVGCQLEERTASSLGLEAGGQYCRLSVHDTGMGMSAEVQQHIFEPFFTTKEEGKGTGLGLATVYGIVKEHRGGIQVRSQLGQGSRFEIYLPCKEAEEKKQDPSLGQPALPHGWETILVVEDEGNLRRLIASLLGGLGYAVLEAERGEAALQVCRDHPGTIALLLTDVVMPGLNGYALAEQVAALRPGIKTLCMSGYAVGIEPPQGLGMHFLPKPFTLAALSLAVRKALDSGLPR